MKNGRLPLGLKVGRRKKMKYPSSIVRRVGGREYSGCSSSAEITHQTIGERIKMFTRRYPQRAQNNTYEFYALYELGCATSISKSSKQNQRPVEDSEPTYRALERR